MLTVIAFGAPKQLTLVLFLCGVASAALCAYHQMKMNSMLRRELGAWALAPFALFARNLPEACRAQRRKLMNAWAVFLVFGVLTLIAHAPGQ